MDSEVLHWIHSCIVGKNIYSGTSLILPLRDYVSRYTDLGFFQHRLGKS